MKSNNTRVRVGRIIYFVLAIIFAMCIITQVFFAGMAVFLYPVDWTQHIMFVHLFGFNLPILLLVFALVGRMPRWAYWQIFGILTAIFLMYFTANVRVGLPWVSTLHPVIGLLLFLLSFSIVFKSWQLIFVDKKSERVESQ